MRSSLQPLLRRAGRVAVDQQKRWLSTADDTRIVAWVALGPPGVGKGTYCTRIADMLGMVHIAGGEIVRAEMKKGSELGKQMEEIVNRGELLPDSMILRVIRKRLIEERADSSTRFLLDGFPRTAPQAEALHNEVNVQLALNLQLREEVLVEKCLGRRICGKCGKNYNIADIYLPASNGRPEIIMPPLSPPPECADHLEQRSDDAEEVIRQRLQVYKDAAKPVEDFYRNRGLLLDFEITGGIPETLPRLLEVLDPYYKAVAQQSASS